MEKRGISVEFITRLESLQKLSQDIDNEQKDIKARLKAKTAKLDEKMKELAKMKSDAKKAVKLEMEREA